MNTQFVKGDCIFTQSAKNMKQYPYLVEDIETEVIIAGGGVTGAILGYYFSKNNIPAVILEKGRIGHGSTSITTSLLQYELDDNAMALTEYIPLEDIVRIYELGMKAIDEIDRFILENGNMCEFKRCDSFLYTDKKLEKKELYEEYEVRKKAGFPVEFIDEYSNPFGFSIKAGVLGKGGGAVFDPYKFTHELLRVSEENGLRIYENSEIVKLVYDEGAVTAETVYGHKVKGKIIIIASGYNTRLFTDRQFGTKTTTFNIVTERIQGIDEIYKNTVIRDNKDPYNYFRTTCDNRIIMGGEDINFQPDIENEKLCIRSYEKLEQHLKDIFREYDIRTAYRYCGAFASTPDNAGFIGKDPNNERLWYNLGYGANGILFAIVGGMMLSNLYKGIESEDMRLFKIDRFDGKQ